MKKIEKILNIYKKIGETPLETLNCFRKHNTEYENVSLTYAGRLDPMAEGVLLVLAGEENKKREQYLSLDKEYRADILFGFETDTYDLLGKVNRTNDEFDTKNFKLRIEKILQNLVGKISQPYPPYSSKPVEG